MYDLFRSNEITSFTGIKLRPFDLSAKNQDVEPILVEMKTKTIVVMLMFVLSWLATNGSACVCPEIVAHVYKQNVETGNGYQSQAIDVSPRDSGDTCADCGHSSTCCSSQNSSAVSPAVYLFDSDVVAVLYQPEAGYARIPDYVGSVKGSRAPPLLRTSTLVAAHQLLLT
jgi:hypothetical protein